MEGKRFSCEKFCAALHKHKSLCSVHFSLLGFTFFGILVRCMNLQSLFVNRWCDLISVTVQSQKLRREDVKVHVADVYRMVAENVWPGILTRRPVLRMHFLRFIEDTVRQVSTGPFENFQDIQPLRYALACVLRSLAVDMVKAQCERCCISFKYFVFMVVC